MATPAAALVIPERPLDRFAELYSALMADRPWWQGRDMLRYSALALATLPGEPRELAARLDATTEELKSKTPWYRRSSVGTMLAALLLRHGGGVDGFLAEIQRAAPLFRAHWRFSGSTFEALAIQLLRTASGDGHVSAAQVDRLHAIWTALKAAHPFLTQRSDWPVCALLATSDAGRGATPSAIAARIESLYQELHAQGASRGDALQTAAELLWFHADPPAVIAGRFQTLYAGFKQSGLWMGSQDYEELALLAFASQPAAEVLGVVMRHRERIRGLAPAPNKQTAFTLACGTALIELTRDAAGVALLSEAQLLCNIHAIIAAQQAAAAAASAT